MTPIYKINTKHSREMLYRFIDFDYKQRHRRIPMHLIVFSICCFTVAFLFYRNYGDIKKSIVWIVVGIVLILLVVLRKHIAFLKLSTHDENYEKQNIISFVFGQSNWSVENDGERAQIQYSQITGFYKDKKYYYISTDENELFLLPFADFVEGDVKQFQKFVEDKANIVTEDLALPFKQRYYMRLAKIKADQAKADEEWEKRRQENKAKALEKKQQKKNKKKKN